LRRALRVAEVVTVRARAFIGAGHSPLRHVRRKREHAGAVALTAGFHPLTFQIYYPTDDNKVLELSCEGPGVARGPLGAELLSHLPASDGK
jgi:hypothetical protein